MPSRDSFWVSVLLPQGEYLCLVYYFADGFSDLPILLSQVFDRLAFPDMIAPNIFMKSLRSSFVLKLFAAILAAIGWYISSLSVLLYLPTFAVRAIFLDMVSHF